MKKTFFLFIVLICSFSVATSQNALPRPSKNQPSQVNQTKPTIKSQNNKTQKNQTTSKPKNPTSSSVNTKKSQTNPATPKPNTSKGLSQLVLYTFEPGEELYYNEYSSNMKSVNNKFVTVTKNANNQKNIIINGKKEITADDVDVSYINFSNNNKIYFYKKDGSWYANINGQKEGPFDDFFVPDNRMPKRFVCVINDSRYMHDSDGKRYPIPEGEWDMENPVYTSFSGNHSITLRPDLNIIIFDNQEFMLPIPKQAQDTDFLDVYVSDRGYATFGVRYKINGDEEYDDYKLTKEGKFKKLDEDDTIALWNEEATAHGLGYPDFNVAWGDINIELTDPNEMHEFTSNWDDDFVVVDNKEFNCTPPFQAFYDDKEDAFAWVSLEGNKLILYSYKF